MANFLDPTSVLRDQAWEALQKSVEFNDFKVLDDAVMRLGGTSILAQPGAGGVAGAVARVLEATQRKAVGQKKMSQADVAENALRKAAAPLPIGRFMSATIDAGAEIGGNNPLANFRSTVSKDARFDSVMRNGMYFWWFKGEALPSGWNEATGPDLLDGPAASSVHSNQGGGDSHAATTAH